VIKHIVMFTIREEANNKSKAEIIAEAKLKSQNFNEEIPTIKKFNFVTNSMEAPDSNYDLALICEFDDIEGLNEYQKHPKHVEFGKFITEVRESRACIDYEF
jgi:predicted metal-dependent HD superfamily phosphohydrolase